MGMVHVRPLFKKECKACIKERQCARLPDSKANKQTAYYPLLRSESSVVERNHSFHIPRNFLRFSTRMALFFSLTSRKTQTVGEDIRPGRVEKDVEKDTCMQQEFCKRTPHKASTMYETTKQSTCA